MKVIGAVMAALSLALPTLLMPAPSLAQPDCSGALQHLETTPQLSQGTTGLAAVAMVLDAQLLSAQDELQRAQVALERLQAIEAVGERALDQEVALEQAQVYLEQVQQRVEDLQRRLDDLLQHLSEAAAAQTEMTACEPEAPSEPAG